MKAGQAAMYRERKMRRAIARRKRGAIVAGLIAAHGTATAVNTFRSNGKRRETTKASDTVLTMGKHIDSPVHTVAGKISRLLKLKRTALAKTGENYDTVLKAGFKTGANAGRVKAFYGKLDKRVGKIGLGMAVAGVADMVYNVHRLRKLKELQRRQNAGTG